MKYYNSKNVFLNQQHCLQGGDPSVQPEGKRASALSQSELIETDGLSFRPVQEERFYGK